MSDLCSYLCTYKLLLFPLNMTNVRVKALRWLGLGFRCGIYVNKVPFFSSCLSFFFFWPNRVLFECDTMGPDYPPNGPSTRGLLFFKMAVSSGQRPVGIWAKGFWA